LQCLRWSWTDLNLPRRLEGDSLVSRRKRRRLEDVFQETKIPYARHRTSFFVDRIGTGDQVIKKKTSHLIFASDGKGLTQLAHIYAEPFEEASGAARKWRDETHPTLWILKVRAQPQGFQAGSVALPGTIEEEEEGANSWILL